MFRGDGASDCGTLTIRRASAGDQASTTEALRSPGVEREVVGVDRRGALLGPEESGRPGSVRVGPVFLGHEATSLTDLCGSGRDGGWLGPTFTDLS
jgi:hypothetical protein